MTTGQLPYSMSIGRQRQKPSRRGATTLFVELASCFSFRAPGPRSFARCVRVADSLHPALRGGLVMLPGDGPAFIGPDRLDDQVSISGELENTRQVLANEEVARNRSQHMMCQRVCRFINVVAPEGGLIPIPDVFIGLSIRRFGVHELYRHMAVTRVDQHAFRLRDVDGLSIRIRRFYVCQIPSSNPPSLSRALALAGLLRGWGLSEPAVTHNLARMGREKV